MPRERGPLSIRTFGDPGDLGIVDPQLAFMSGGGNGVSRETSPRSLLVEAWRQAQAEWKPYQTLGHTSGTRLIISGQHVMDTCERPWVEASVDAAFEGMRRNGHLIRVLTRGFGLGIAETLVMRKLNDLGSGHLTVIELNKDVAEKARQWRIGQLTGISRMSTGELKPIRPDMTIRVIEGDAIEGTQELFEKGEKFDVIFSDTYPLSPEEVGINDLLDLAVLKRMLTPDGRFTFFAFFPGSRGGVPQRDMLGEHFADVYTTEIELDPPPPVEYTYLQGPSGPVRRLPVVRCKLPKIEYDTPSDEE